MIEAERPPRFGCRRDDCTAPREYDTSGTPAPPLDPAQLSGFSDYYREKIAEDVARHNTEIAHHEAGHALVAALFKRGVEYATTGRTPHVKYQPGGGERTEEAMMTCTLAGRAAVDLFRHHVASPSHDEMQHFLTKARQNEAGPCDECSVARLLVALYPDETDDEIMKRWIEHYQRTVERLDAFENKIVVSKIARALEAKVRLDEGELAEMLGWRVQVDG